MKLPKAGAIANEAVITIAGAILAAFVIGQLPGLKVWIKRQWE